MIKALQIRDFPNYYITTIGTVYSRIYNPIINPNCRIKKLRTAFNRKHYECVCLTKNHKKHTKKIHRLVAETFIPNPENKPEVNHKNGNKADNRIENLEWVTASENMQHAHKVLGIKSSNFGKFGKDNHSSKPVKQIKNGKTIAIYGSMREAERKTKICDVGISACCKGKAKSAGGYQWKYA